MGRRKTPPRAIAPIVRRVLAKLGRQRPSPLARVQTEWPEIVGKRLALHSQPMSLKRGLLMVKVDQSGWLYQLRVEQPRVLAVLEERLGLGVIRAIQSRIGELHVSLPW